jgi:hypothetical protein
MTALSIRSDSSLALLSTDVGRGIHSRSVYIVNNAADEEVLVENLEFHLIIAFPATLQRDHLESKMLDMWSMEKWNKGVLQQCHSKLNDLKEVMGPALVQKWHSAVKTSQPLPLAPEHEDFALRQQQFAAIECAVTRLEQLRKASSLHWKFRNLYQIPLAEEAGKEIIVQEEGEEEEEERPLTFEEARISLGCEAYFFIRNWEKYTIPRTTRIAQRLKNHQAWRLRFDNHSVAAFFCDKFQRGPLTIAEEQYVISVLQPPVGKEELSAYRGSGEQLMLGQTLAFPSPQQTYEWSFSDNRRLEGLLQSGTTERPEDVKQRPGFMSIFTGEKVVVATKVVDAKKRQVKLGQDFSLAKKRPAAEELKREPKLKKVGVDSRSEKPKIQSLLKFT